MGNDSQRSRARWALIGFGVAGLVAGASALVIAVIVVGIVLVPFLVWLAWNVLDFGAAIGAQELSFWGVVLMTLFLTVGFGGRVVIALMVWLIDPKWLADSAELNWPQPSFRTFIALALLLMVAQLPAHTHEPRRDVPKTSSGAG